MHWFGCSFLLLQLVVAISKRFVSHFVFVLFFRLCERERECVCKCIVYGTDAPAAAVLNSMSMLISFCCSLILLLLPANGFYFILIKHASKFRTLLHHKKDDRYFWRIAYPVRRMKKWFGGGDGDGMTIASNEWCVQRGKVGITVVSTHRHTKCTLNYVWPCAQRRPSSADRYLWLQLQYAHNALNEKRSTHLRALTRKKNMNPTEKTDSEMGVFVR